MKTKYEPIQKKKKHITSSFPPLLDDSLLESENRNLFEINVQD